MARVPEPSSTYVPARLDTVGIAVPCDDFDRVGCTETIENRHTPNERHTYRRTLAGGGFVGTGVGHAAWIEASLPKRATEDRRNDVALEVGDALDVLHGLYVEASQFLDIPRGHAFDESRIVRLDLVRDFHDVDCQTELLDGLAAIDQPGRSKVRRFADPSANRAETLRVGPRAWGCTLYDKHTESRGQAPQGQIRFEARLHRSQLTSAFARANGGHFASVADVIRCGRLDGTADGGASLARAQRAWFERVGFDRSISARWDIVRVMRAADLTNAQAAGLWAYLTLEGWHQTASKNTRAKYRAIADTLGLVPVFEGGSSPELHRSIRLDYDSGTIAA